MCSLYLACEQPMSSLCGYGQPMGRLRLQVAHAGMSSACSLRIAAMGSVLSTAWPQAHPDDGERRVAQRVQHEGRLARYEAVAEVVSVLKL